MFVARASSQVVRNATFMNGLRSRSKYVVRDYISKSFLSSTSCSNSEDDIIKIAQQTPGNSAAHYPVLDFAAWKQNPEAIQTNANNRGVDVDVSHVLGLHSKYSQLLGDIQAVSERRNKIAKGKVPAELEIDENVDKSEWMRNYGRELKAELSRLKDEEVVLKRELYKAGGRIPNNTHPDVVVGPEENARLVREFGTKPEFDFTPKNHIELGLALDWMDFDSSTTVSGIRTVMLKNMGAALELALSNWVISKLTKKGFKLILPSDFVRHDFVSRCGFLPGGQEITSRHVYSVNEELCLAGTSELTITALHFDSILRPKELPKKYVGLSHCFRPEAPHGGQESRGLYRLHQFSKVEMVVICAPEESEVIHAELLQNELEIFSELGLYGRVLDMPTEELGAPAYRKYDIEAWMPGRNSFGEISSTSNCTDYQTRRLHTRIKETNSPRVFAHSLNGTGCAIPRTILAIMEQFQTKEVKVKIPQVLHPFIESLGFSTDE